MKDEPANQANLTFGLLPPTAIPKQYKGPISAQLKRYSITTLPTNSEQDITVKPLPGRKVMVTFTVNKDLTTADRGDLWSILRAVVK